MRRSRGRVEGHPQTSGKPKEPHIILQNAEFFSFFCEFSEKAMSPDARWM
jgi:hypothetical protein